MDDSLDYLRSIKDPRIVLISLPQNKGITRALQEGMNQVNGKYIVRLDADDIAMPNRIGTQVAFMEGHIDIGISGSSCDIINREGHKIGEKLNELDDSEIRWRILFKNPFVHSTVIIRYSVLLKNRLGYSNLDNIEDYVLWAELLKSTKAHILAIPLIKYRIHPQSITQKSNLKQLQNREVFSMKLLYSILKKKRSPSTIRTFYYWIIGKSNIYFFDLITALRIYAEINEVIAFTIKDIKVQIQFKENRVQFLKRRNVYFIYRLVNLV
jgi:glycosyltransferase involved in cell wall biosynthesis